MLRKRFLYKIVGFSILLYLLAKGVQNFIRPHQNDDYKLNIPHQNDDYKLNIQLIERSIRSPLNKDVCQHPDLPADNPEILKLYKPVEPINCGNSLHDWVTCEKSICFVKPQIIANYGEITCTYNDLIRRNDYSISYGEAKRTTKTYLLQKSDFVKVFCRSNNWIGRKTWSGYVYGIRDRVERPVPKVMQPPPYNVLMFGFDSMSRNAFIRELPKSYEYLVNELNAIVLKDYNIVGDGTSQALIPILTGYTELELPETRSNMPNAIDVDAYPMIWKEYAQQGYVTSFNEDLPKFGTFTNRLKGFNKQPVHHYLRTFYVALDRIWSILNKFCIGNTPSHMVMLDYTKTFMKKYKNTPGFIFSFHGELSHESMNFIGAIDDDFLLWLQQLRNDSLLDNTILIVMSDHGNRFSEARDTLQGKQEERLPFFSFTFPHTFKKRFPQQYQKFLQNSKRLSTPFDIHATLKDILALQLSVDRFDKISKQLYSYIRPKFQTNAPERAISLFKNIPKNRSCADAYIEPHWCACLKWDKLSLNNSINYMIAQKSAHSIISMINNLTMQYHRLCARLKLKAVNWLLKLSPYKDNKDSDVVIADFTNMKIVEEIYQIQIVTTPGDALFEASVQHDLVTNVVNAKISEISRINNYGAQSSCIYYINPELRKYCYCRS